jgi:hypothetical protein
MGLAAVVMSFAALGAAHSASAVDDGTLGIRPANESDFFHLSVYPGAATEATAVVSNHTSEPVTLLTYPVDAINSEAGFAMADMTAPRAGVGAWVHLDANEVTIPANSDLNVAFRVDVPANTTPGDYAGAVIIQSPAVEGETATVDGNTAVRMDVIQRQGVRIYLDVAGEAITSLDHGELTWDKGDDQLRFSLPVSNTGNTILHPAAEVILTDWAGGNTTLSFDAPESLLPGATQVLHAQLQEAPLVGAGNAGATITSEAGTARAATSYSYAAWELIAGVLTGLLVLVLAAWRIARFVRRARSALAQVSSAPAKVHSGQALPQAPQEGLRTSSTRSPGGRHVRTEPQHQKAVLRHARP